MKQIDLIRDIILKYRKHGWELKRVLVRPETRVEVLGKAETAFEEAAVDQSDVDALWFSRPSHGGREAWELRLVTETSYAIFETFEKDEPEELREEARKEMEGRLREYVSRT